MPVFDPGGDPSIFPENWFGVLGQVSEGVAAGIKNRQERQRLTLEGQRVANETQQVEVQKRLAANQEAQVALEQQREKRIADTETMDNAIKMAGLPNAIRVLMGQPPRELTDQEQATQAGIALAGVQTAQTRLATQELAVKYAGAFVDAKGGPIRDVSVDAKGNVVLPAGAILSPAYEQEVNNLSKQLAIPLAAARKLMYDTIANQNDVRAATSEQMRGTAAQAWAYARYLDRNLGGPGGKGGTGAAGAASTRAAIATAAQLYADADSQGMRFAPVKRVGKEEIAAADVPGLVKEISDLALRNQQVVGAMLNPAMAQPLDNVFKDAARQVLGSRVMHSPKFTEAFASAEGDDKLAGIAKNGPAVQAAQAKLQQALVGLDSTMLELAQIDPKTGQRQGVEVAGAGRRYQAIATLAQLAQQAARSRMFGNWIIASQATQGMGGDASTGSDTTDPNAPDAGPSLTDPFDAILHDNPLPE